MDDPHNLKRFLDAQAGTHDQALSEVRAGLKRSHWMWFIFPQLAGLGRSETARFYGISSLAEARAYLAHPVLGERLRTMVQAVQGLQDASAERVFGPVDAMKLRSSLTLFSAAGGDPIFDEAIARWFPAGPDENTLALLADSA
jgi:uncharacterized protein (DUF1810 family)